MDDLLKEIESLGVVINGHFIGTSGKHLSVYIAKNNILPHTGLTSRISERFASKASQWNPDIVVAPATGGIALSQWTANHMSVLLKREVLSIYTEQVDGVHSLTKRGYDAFVKGKKVVVLEDVVNTGKSIKEVVDAVRHAGGDVVGAMSIFNRNKTDDVVSEMLGTEYSSLFLMPLDSYEEDGVPEDLRKIAINTEYGHGAKYLKDRGMAQ
jgi:orotate phosphoribosyltransferase